MSGPDQFHHSARSSYHPEVNAPTPTLVIPLDFQHYISPALHSISCTRLSLQSHQNHSTLYKNMLESWGRCRLWRDHREVICRGSQVGDDKGQTKGLSLQHSTSTSDPCCCPRSTGSARVKPGGMVTARRHNPKPTTAPPQMALHIPAAPSGFNPGDTSSWRRLYPCKSSATFTFI